MHLDVPPIILQHEIFSITRAHIGAAPERTCTIRLPSRKKVTIRVECQPPIDCSLREGNQTARGISLPCATARLANGPTRVTRQRRDTDLYRRMPFC